MNKNIFSTLMFMSVLFNSASVYSQNLGDSIRCFLDERLPSQIDTILPNGKSISYVQNYMDIWYLSHGGEVAKFSMLPVIYSVEGYIKDEYKEGIYSTYIYDCAQGHKKYKYSEQHYVKGKIQGDLKYFNIDNGKLVKVFHYQNGEATGRTEYDDNGIDKLKTYFYLKDGKFKEVIYHPNGKVSRELIYEDNKAEGLGRKFYTSGVLMDETNYKNGERDGKRTYYYPNGEVWIITEFKEGKLWNIIVNNDSRENQREMGTLKNGTGTFILYEDDNSIREILEYVNGERVSE